MPNIEINAGSTACRKCGISYGRLKGNFPISYSSLYKGTGYMPICRACVDKLYSDYMEEHGDEKDAARQVCRKLDIYWNDDVFDSMIKQCSNRSVMTTYLVKVNSTKYVGKSYDDTLREEHALWTWPTQYRDITPKNVDDDIEIDDDSESDYEVPDDVARFWGPGYTPKMYEQLEQRRKYWMSRYPHSENIDIGTEAIIRQICSLEIDINRDRAAGKAIDKNVNALNALLGSASLKPGQKLDSADPSLDTTPFGVWINRWENVRPIPEPDPELKDVDGIIRYIDIWFRGHMAKMCGLKNAFSKLYDDKISNMRIERPEYDDEDDESMFNDIFSSEGGDAIE